MLHQSSIEQIHYVVQVTTCEQRIVNITIYSAYTGIFFSSFLYKRAWKRDRKIFLVIFYGIYVRGLEKSYKNLLTTKSNDRMSDFVNGHASMPYNKAGMHLLLMSCIMTASEAILPILPNMQFAAR